MSACAICYDWVQNFVWERGSYNYFSASLTLHDTSARPMPGRHCFISETEAFISVRESLRVRPKPELRCGFSRERPDQPRYSLKRKLSEESRGTVSCLSLHYGIAFLRKKWGHSLSYKRLLGLIGLLNFFYLFCTLLTFVKSATKAVQVGSFVQIVFKKD